MASEVGGRRAKFKLITGGLNDLDSNPEKSKRKPTIFGRCMCQIAKNWVVILGVGALLSFGVVGLNYIRGEKGEVRMIGFNVNTNLLYLLDNVDRWPSRTRRIALQNLETIEKVRESELIELKKAIEKVERKCNACGDLLERLKTVEKRWKAYVEKEKGKPVSDLRWRRPTMPKIPSLKRVPQKVARSKC